MSQGRDILSALPQELQIQIFAKLSYLDIARLKAVCRALRDIVGGEHLRNALARCGHVREFLSPLKFFWQNKGLEWIGYDHTSQRWSRLPSLRTLLPELLLRRSPRQIGISDRPEKPFLVSTSGGLLCIEVSKRRDVECIIVCNPVTQCRKVLPPLNFRGKPELMHITVDTRTNAYHVIVVGSNGRHNLRGLAMKSEVYSSRSGRWEVKEYTPEPSCDTSDLVFQSGAVLHDIFFCLATDGLDYKVLAYNLQRGKWLNSWRCSPPEQFRYCPPGYVGINPQLVECKDRIILFWKRSSTQDVTFFGFATLEEFQNGDEPKPEWHTFGPVWYRGECFGALEYNLKHVCSPCKAADDANECYVVVMDVMTGAARKCNVEDYYRYTLDPVQALPAPALRYNQEPQLTLNPLSFSFEPGFVAAV